MAEVQSSGSAVATSHVQTHLSRFPSDLLDRQCTESHLGKLVHCINLDTMFIMAADLGLTHVEVDDIRDSWPGKPALQRLEMLKRSRITYRYAPSLVPMPSMGRRGNGGCSGGLELLILI